MKNKFVDDYGWISEEEMLNFVAIAQSAPGAIAVNGAIVIGFKLAGFMGVIVSILGTIIPPFIVFHLFPFLFKGFDIIFGLVLWRRGCKAEVGPLEPAVAIKLERVVLKKKVKQ